MKRIEVIDVVSRQGGLIVANLGFPSRELYSLHDRAQNFYMLGSMGMASALGLGLAVCQQQTVTVIDGDGSVLMNPGTLVTIAHNAPQNLRIVIVDNHTYGSTGDQPTYTAGRADLKRIAVAAGNSSVVRVRTREGLRRALRRTGHGHRVIIVETEPGNASVPVVPILPVAIKARFMDACRNAYHGTARVDHGGTQ